MTPMARYRRAAGIDPPAKFRGIDPSPARLAVCQTCEHLRGVSVKRLYVLCASQTRRCACPHGEVMLGYGRCPARKWIDQ